MSTSTEGVVEVERRIAARPETVFSYLIDPDHLRLWQGADAELDPRPGGVFRFRSAERPHYVASGQYVVVDPPSRLVFTWGWEPNDELLEGQDTVAPGASTVEMVLVRDGDATILRLRHSGLPDDAARQFHGAGWELVLDRVVAGAGGARP